MYQCITLDFSQQLSGHYSNAIYHQQIGDVRHSYNCLQLSARGDFLSFKCPGPHKGVWALELIELHQKEDIPFCYNISINGVPVHQQSMEPLSSTLCPCFIKLSLSPEDEVCITNMTDAPMRFTSISLHADVDDLCTQHLTPMEIGLCFPRPTYTDQAADIALFQRIRDDFANLQHFTIAAGIEITYMLLNDADLLHRFRWVLTLAKETGVALIFNFNSWWDGTPDGRDGTGGYFGDVQYQQVVYDPLTGQTRLSIPNMWRNTPWYTMNSEQLNTARKERLTRALALLAQSAAEMDMAAQYRIFIDNEPTYWAEFAYSQSPESGGDFSAAAINAAAQDGVDLAPDGAVTPQQKEWLLHNHSTYISDIAKQYHTCHTQEIATLDDTGLHYTNNHLAENTLTHIFPHAAYPYATGKHLMYEQHVTPWARLGIECAGFQDERILAYASATGRFGQVNAERCCYTDPRFHLQLYAHGAFTDIIFNYFYDTDVQHLHALDHLVTEPMPHLAYGRTVTVFNAYEDKLDAPPVVCHSNMAISPLRERWVLRPKKLGKGSITLHIGHTEIFPSGGWLELSGLIRPLNGQVTLSMGHTPDCSTLSIVLPERDADYQHIPLRIPLEELLQTTGDLFLRLEIESNYYDDWAQMNSVWLIRAVASLHNTQTATEPFTLQELRALSSQLSLRMDTQRLLEQHPDTDSAKAAYMQVMHDISVAQTRTFLIRSRGTIPRFGVEVISYQGAPLLTFPTNESRSASLSGSPGSFVRLRDVNGEWTLTTTEPPLPAAFAGTFLHYDSTKGILRATTHQLRDWAWQPYLDFPCAANAQVSITPHAVSGDMLDHISSNPYTPAAIVNARIDTNPTLSSLKTGDAITLHFTDGLIREVNAVRGLARGRLLKITPMTWLPEARNTQLLLETAPDQTITFELGTQTHLNYVKAPAENAMLAGTEDLRLDIGCTLLGSFEAESVRNRPLRATEITVV